MREPRPVVVVGAGPVGLTAALALRARGVDDVLVVEAEAAQRRRPGSRAIFQHRASLQLYERNHPGLGFTLARHGLVWPVKRTLYRGREVYVRRYPPWRGDGLPPLTSLPQSRIEALLLDACEAAAVGLRWRWPVGDAAVDADGVRLVGPDGETLTADYVVAADGPRSTVRANLGIALDGERSRTSFVIVDVAESDDDPLPPERIYHYRHPAVGGRNVLLVPFAGGWRADIQLRADDDPEEFSAGEGLDRWVGRVLPPRYARRVSWVSTYRFQHAVAERLVDAGGRVLLAGEAAHTFAPFGARGLNSGVADADAAAAAIAQARSARDPALARAAVEGFAAERRQAALRNRDAARAALTFMEAGDPRLRLRQEVAARLAPRIRRFGRWLDAAPYGPRLDEGGPGGY